MNDEDWIVTLNPPRPKCVLCRKYSKVSKRLDELLDLLEKKKTHAGYKQLYDRIRETVPTYKVDPRTFHNHMVEHKNNCRSQNE